MLRQMLGKGAETMKNWIYGGTGLSILGWLTLLFGSSVGVAGRDVINFQMLSIAQMMIVTGHVMSVIGAILLAAEKIIAALSFLPEIERGLAAQAQQAAPHAVTLTSYSNPANVEKSAPTASELRQSLDALKAKS